MTNVQTSTQNVKQRFPAYAMLCHAQALHSSALTRSRLILMDRGKSATSALVGPGSIHTKHGAHVSCSSMCHDDGV